ncbi:putative ribosomal protein S5 domain 2-type [Rosa chinensis]|uniref:Putative ribosomal protein S5 domain 2-type n=1 Tax=Rosa chinensis TaxID=74649 RepID=A0A2P6RQ12_ROSCH|nr:putative ribosomal protein S5 domain 2-type [Rosa chinensis]
MVTSSSRGGTYTTIKEHITFDKEIKKSKFIVLAASVSDEQSALSILSQVGDQYRSNDDGEPSGTTGKPIHSAIESSGIDRVMVLVIREYGGVTSECLRDAPTHPVKSKVLTFLLCFRAFISTWVPKNLL